MFAVSPKGMTVVIAGTTLLIAAARILAKRTTGVALNIMNADQSQS
ncbi:hypothetical protein [uncultured Thiodictyon sp.]|nr:hypothetical protein [uncultured Thiodictyon sp.]